MSWLLRTLIVCTLVLALPVQGWASAVMTYCGPQGEPTAATAGDHAAHGHGDAAAAADPVNLGNHDCSACAACSAGVLLPTALLRLPAHEPAAGAIAWTATHMLGHVGSGLERPPRSLLG